MFPKRITTKQNPEYSIQELQKWRAQHAKRQSFAVHHACGACTLQVQSGRPDQFLQAKSLPLKCLPFSSTLARFKPSTRQNMFSWAVTLLILAVVVALLAIWGIAGMPGWMVRGLYILLIILCLVAAFLA
jgi:uncharacterized membrane protein YtjA (UPF0391 family)